MAFVRQGGTGQPVAMRRLEFEDDSQPPTTETLYYLHHDHLGSMVLLTDDQGNAVEETWYPPFGDSLYDMVTTDRGYTGQRFDAVADLYYYGARWYDSHLGQFTQPASFAGPPEASQGLNRYAMPAMPSVSAVSSAGGGVGIEGFPWSDLWQSSASNTISAVVDEVALSKVAKRLASRAPWYWLSIEGSDARGGRSLLARLLRERPGPVSVSRRLARGTLDEWSGVVSIPHNYEDLLGRLGRKGFSIRASPIARRVWELGPKHLTIGDIVPGIGADFLVGGLWQLGEDLLTHPELLNDPGLLGRRAAAGAMSNVTTGLGGMSVAAVGAWIVTGFGVTVAAPAVVVGGVVATIAIELLWGEQVENWWFERLNACAPWE